LYNGGKKQATHLSRFDGYAFSRNHFVLNSSSLEMVPAARRAARFERLAIKGHIPFVNLTKMTASSVAEKNTFSMLLCCP
jgi:hypothetical protein